MKLENYSKDKYTQFGEDGIIIKCLDLLPKVDGWCVEFGAWDGKHFSNTRNLIETRNYKAVLIEGDEKRANLLKEHYRNDSSVIPICRYVGYSVKDNLDNILSETNIPKEFDLLVVDVDGVDFYLWEATNNYKPKIVCIEYNATIPPEVDFIQEKTPKLKQGASLLSLCKLAKKKGYELICTTVSNAFFVDSKYFDYFNITDNTPGTLQNRSRITYIFSTQDGNIFLRGSKRVPCHEIYLREKDVQCVPKILRVSPTDFNIFQKLIYIIWIAFREPRSFVKLFKRVISQNQ